MTRLAVGTRARVDTRKANACGGRQRWPLAVFLGAPVRDRILRDRLLFLVSSSQPFWRTGLWKGQDAVADLRDGRCAGDVRRTIEMKDSQDNSPMVDTDV